MTDLVQRLRDWATDYKVNGVLKCVIYEAADRIEALERENAELRKDAERYRWLRLGKRLVVNCKSAVIHHAPNPEKNYAESLDAAIDEAMK